MKQNKIWILAALLLLSCTDVETIDRKTVGPQQQDPARWAEYLAALNAYKTSEHFLTYASMRNAPEVSTSPGDFLRALPDSLDYVALTRPLSAFDQKDLPAVQEKGTKVLMRADCTDAATAAAAVDVALAQIAACGLDGLVLWCGTTPPDDALLQRAAAKSKTLIFEGAAALAAASDLYDLYILDLTQTANIYSVREEVDYATEHLGLDAGRLLLGASPMGKIADTQLKAQPALTQLSLCVLSYGTLAGVAVFDLTEDYYDPNGSYPRTKAAITLLNPAVK